MREFRVEIFCFTFRTDYVGIQICMIYSFFVKPTVVSTPSSNDVFVLVGSNPTGCTCLHIFYFLHIIFSDSEILGNTILVKLELWESVMVIIIFGLPLTYAYATLRQSVAGNSTFWGIFFCNLGTPKTVISKFVTSWQIETPYLSPYGYPNNVPVGQKWWRRQNGGADKCINSLVSHKLSHDC
jgi:hypothetical protein